MISAPAHVYPLFLLLRGRLVVVVGAGAVAERKVSALLEAGASVRVVATRAAGGVAWLADRGEIELRLRPFCEEDLDGAWLVIAATDDPTVQRWVGEACDARRLFCMAVDDLENATAYAGSVISRPPFLVAISSSAQAPALTRLLREILESSLPAEAWIARARELRRSWKERGVPMDQRFTELVRRFAAIGASGDGDPSREPP